MALITFVLVVVFGGLTLFFHNDEFIKWKVTVIYALFAGALLVSQWVMKKPLIQRMLGKEPHAAATGMVEAESGLAVFFILAVWQTSTSHSGCRKIFGSTLKSLA